MKINIQKYCRKKTFILFLSLFLASGSYGQVQQARDKLRQPIPELPFASLEKAGFNEDSIENLLTLINETRFPDFRGIVVIKMSNWS